VSTAAAANSHASRLSVMLQLRFLGPAYLGPAPAITAAWTVEASSAVYV